MSTSPDRTVIWIVVAVVLELLTMALLEAGAGRRNALDRGATLASRAAGQGWRSR